MFMFHHDDVTYVSHKASAVCSCILYMQILEQMVLFTPIFSRSVYKGPKLPHFLTGAVLYSRLSTVWLSGYRSQLPLLF